VRRAKTAERDGKVAVVLEVPIEECPSCGDRWMSWEVSRRLDELLRSMLDSDVELATRRSWLEKPQSPWAVWHDLPIGTRGANVDHLVVGPGGVFSVNTKKTHGRVWLGAAPAPCW